MDSERESSPIISSVVMPPPPPPPPPPMSMHNANLNEQGRSLLLADIRKGATLKKAPVLNDSNHNELSPNDKLKKQTQDLLQAELTSTLKRRKPVVINEPAKYEYPTYDDSNDSNKINKNNESSNSTGANANTTNVKPLNVSAVLSVVTGIKIPDVQYHSQTSVTKASANDKPKITHGKANFTIGSKENRSNVPTMVTLNGPSAVAQSQPVLTSPKAQIKSPENADAKLHRPSYFTSHLMATTDKSNSAKSVPDTNSESQVEKCKSIFLVKSQKSIENANIKPQNSPQKTKLISKFEATPVAVEQPKEEIKKKQSIDETKDNVSFVSVANKKALFEKPAQNGTMPRNNLPKNAQSERNLVNKPALVSISNGKFNTLNGQRNISQTNRQQKPGVTTVSLNKNVSYGSLGRPQGKDRVDHIERTVRTVNETTSTNNNGKVETKQFEQKTFVSFSKDLLNAPNNYPDQIRVKKTVITKSSHIVPNHPFENIRFSIQTNGQVIPKPKNL